MYLYSDGWNCWPTYIDIYGNAIKRTPFTNPYNYDEYVIWRRDSNTDEPCDLSKSSAVYSDRLFQWDPEKYNRCCKEVFGDIGQYFNTRNPDKIQQFLSIYFEKDVELLAIVQGCNQFSGFPYWIFLYEELNN